MTIHLGRVPAALALPVVLLFTATACGGSEEKEPVDKPATSAPATTDDMPSSMGDIPDPRKDPEAFEGYLAGVFQESGMPEPQASCMAKAYMDNVDPDKMTDSSAILDNEEMEQAIAACR